MPGHAAATAAATATARPGRPVRLQRRAVCQGARQGQLPGPALLRAMLNRCGFQRVDHNCSSSVELVE
jgi:hypothetical protein